MRLRLLIGIAALAGACFGTTSASADATDAYTSLSISANPTVIVLNQAVFLSGTLTEKDTPEALAGASVTLSRFTDQNCTQGRQQFTAVTTDSSGNWSATDVSPLPPPVYYRADFAGGSPSENPEDGDVDNFLPSSSDCFAVVAGRNLSGQAQGDVTVDGVPFDTGGIAYGATISMSAGSKVKLSANVGRFAVYPGRGTATSFIVRRVLLGKGKNRQALISLQLVGGDLGLCKQTKTSGLRTESAEKKPPKRSLWASGKGHYRTTGKYSSATVQGTYWFTEDTCDGTYTYVKRGVVAVYDFVKNVVVLVHAGHGYFAHAPH